MSISVVWAGDEQNVLVYDFAQSWTWSAFDEALKAGAACMSSVPHKVDIIFNLGSCKTIPEGATLHLRSALAQLPANTGMIAVATSTPMIMIAFSIVAQIHRHIGDRLITVPDLDAALSALSHPYALRNKVTTSEYKQVSTDDV